MKCVRMPPSTLSSACAGILFTVLTLLWTFGERCASQSSYGPPGHMPPVVRHPGTCTFQRSQPACTFSLLCYMAGGVPIEGCGGDIAMTCCLLYGSGGGGNSLGAPPIAGPPPPIHPHLSSPYHSPPSVTSHHHYAAAAGPPPQHHLQPVFTPQIGPPAPAVVQSHHQYVPQTHYAHSYEPQPTAGPSYESVDSNAVRRTVPALPVTPDYSAERHQYARTLNFAGDDVCGRPSAKPRSRIIGGHDAFFGEFPWQVHIKISKHQCGGALVNREFVVTAAHCVYQAPMHQLSIIIGAHDIEDQRYQDEPPQFFSVAEVRLHPNFRFSASHPDRYDVAVLRLDKAAHYTDNVLPVCLPPKDINFEGWHGVVTGWGKTDPALSNRYGTRLLQKVDVPIIKNGECENWHQTRGIDLKIFPEMMCAGYESGQKDACVGDSGGPLVVFLKNRWTLAGITSAGFGCAQSRQPGIYHRLPLTVDWVLQNIQ